MLCMGLRMLPWFSLLFLLPLSVSAQYAMAIRKVSNGLELRYSPGEEIRFKLREEDYFHRSVIQAVSDTGLVFQHFNIAFSELEKVDLQGRRFAVFPFRSVGTVLIVGGLGLIAADWFNQQVVQGNDYEAPEGMLIAGGAAAAAGIVLRLLEPKRLVLDHRYRVVAVRIPQSSNLNILP